ncbi:MAG: hypothetical protein WEC33_03525 [Dehalococcoidia bacterium]
MAQCGIGRLFKRCQQQASHVCQYCGRDFCDAHTHFIQGHEAVCGARFCVAKHEDLKIYNGYKAAVEGRNGARLCGALRCEEPLGSGCSLCRGEFCEGHVSHRRYQFREGRGMAERWVSICAVCWDRRRIWRRMR